MDMHALTPVRNVIVIGGSHGALDVLRIMLGKLPHDFPAAILIVIHTATSSPGYLASILDRYSSLPVEYGRDGDEVQVGRIYLAPADKHLEIVAPGIIHLGTGPKVRFSRPAADRLFETAAQFFGDRVISLVLSGGDSDGSDGANAVIAAGGLSLVQEPEDALVPSMPINLIRKDHPRAVLKDKDMASVLMQAVYGLIT